MPLVVLLGDSVFDNQSYTGGEPDVARHLRALLPSRWDVSLCAVDGTYCDEIAGQLSDVPSAATHLVLSVGGNDALRNMDLLDMDVETMAAALDLLRRRVEAFEKTYAAALDAVLKRRLPTFACTIYNGNFDGQLADRARTALMLFNDAILRTCMRRGVGVIELRHVCTETRDFANPIEPSGPGGLKIAEAVAEAIGQLPPPRARTVVISGR